MPSSKAIKGQLAFIKSMQKLIEALKEIDASHFMALAKAKEEQFEHFSEIIRDYLKMAYGFTDKTGGQYVLLKPIPGAATGVIVMSSDASFMGKLNTSVCKETTLLLEELDTDIELMVLGKKGLVRLRYANAKVTPFAGLKEATRYEQVVELRNYVLRQREEGKIGDLWLVAPRNLCFGKHEIDKVKLLPAVDFLHDRIEIQLESWQELCLESDMKEIVRYLVETWLITKLYDYSYESKLAEYSARTMHLEGSLDYLSSQVKQLSLSYNKARQGETDAGLRETFASLMGSSM